jgi:hypothetical protein
MSDERVIVSVIFILFAGGIAAWLRRSMRQRSVSPTRVRVVVLGVVCVSLVAAISFATRPVLPNAVTYSGRYYSVSDTRCESANLVSSQLPQMSWPPRPLGRIVFVRTNDEGTYGVVRSFPPLGYWAFQSGPSRFGPMLIETADQCYVFAYPPV